jgi:hypothetical protein
MSGAKKPSAFDRAPFSVAVAIASDESILSCHKLPRFGRERGKKPTTVTLLQQRDGLRG